METRTLDSVGADVTLALPDWLTNPDPAPLTLSKEAKKLHVARFESVFPRVMDMIASGYDMTTAVAELPVEVDAGAFRRWVKKDPMRHEALKEAEELRSEVWADKMMKHATGVYEMEDVQRSKLVVDTYKWRIAADNRRKYGETKTVEFGGSISITGALAQAQARVIEAEVTDVSDATPRLENDDDS